MNRFKRRSTILKIVSILMIIFAAILIAGCSAGIIGLQFLSDRTDIWILDLALGFGKMFLIRLIITKGISLAAGICGLTLKRRKPLMILGVIVLILTAVSCATKFFIPFVWVLMAPPMLYMVGIKRCKG